MQVKRSLIAAGALFALAGVSPAAAAAPPAALNQYEVSGRVTADQLARDGYDLTESGSRPGTYGIVATAKQAKALRDKGATVVAPSGESRSLKAAPADPLATPLTHGYNVFRPWSLSPAPCPGTCTTDLKPLKQWYAETAKANPGLVKEVKIGKTIRGQDIVAYKVTKDARRVRDGKRPVTLYESTQHAREWISAETNRRLFKWFVDHAGDREIAPLLRQNEIWFIPVMNPDGYDYTFTGKANRLWRKNLRDVNGDGAVDPANDGVDLNRNWPHKWNYDLEGSSDQPDSATYHGTGPASEPETQAARGLHQRLRPKFLIDYHSYGPLILYPEGWQVETEATDGPLLKTLAGEDEHPAIPGYDPDVSGELYITNGDVTGDVLNAWGTQSYTVELNGGSGPPVGGTDGAEGLEPAGFVFQDDEAAVQAEFEKNLDFALDLARAAARPDEAQSHLGPKVPDFVPTTFGISHGSPQTVEVNAKRSLGRVEAHWRVNGGRERHSGTREFRGGERYGKPGTYFHKLRADIGGLRAGDEVEVWFEAGHGRKAKRSTPFTFTVKSTTGNEVLLLTAEDYTGRTAAPPSSPEPESGPKYQDDYEAALKAAGVRYDVYDVDANGRTAASPLGVLSHYRAVIWQTGDDIYPREPNQPNGTGASKLADDEILAARDYLNEGGKLLVAGRYALQAAWDQVLYHPFGAPPAPFCTAVDTPARCTLISNDFQQYWLGAFQPISVPTDGDAPLALQGSGGIFGDLEFGINGEDSAANQDQISSFLTTSSVLPVDEYPQFRSEQAVKLDRPAAFDPPTGTHYVFSQASNDAYKRLTKTIDLTGKSSADLSFTTSFDTEPGWDFVFVEAHVVGEDDWTTLPDANGHTSQDVGASCAEIPTPQEHPFLEHYLRYTPPAVEGEIGSCAPTGTTGAWHAATGNSGGQQRWKVDLTPYAGKQVEVSITSMSDPGIQGLGVFVDDAKVTADGATLEETSFEDGLGGWAVPGAPEGSTGNANDWKQTESVGYVEGPGVATADTLLWGFGLEGVTGAETRSALLKQSLDRLTARR